VTRYLFFGIYLIPAKYAQLGFWGGINSIVSGVSAPEIISTYFIVYVLLPRQLEKKKYIAFSISTLLTIGLVYIISSFAYLDMRSLLTKPCDQDWLNLLDYTRHFFVSGPPAICSLFITVKMLKNWFRKKEEKEILSNENMHAELQLLKAQVHPHFLFNTLNNIYSFTLNKSPKAAKLVLNLSDTLHYMIVECDPALVPVEKELKMIKNYIKLERIRYGDRLDIDVRIGEGHKNKAIAPLLLIPFVENSFKHGTSQMLQHPWIKLNIDIKENELQFELTNSKPDQVGFKDDKKGIGLTNVRKRLNLLYPGNHFLEIESKSETFFVSMRVPLEDLDKLTEVNFVKEKPLAVDTAFYAEH